MCPCLSLLLHGDFQAVKLPFNSVLILHSGSDHDFDIVSRAVTVRRLQLFDVIRTAVKSSDAKPSFRGTCLSGGQLSGAALVSCPAG